MSLAYWLVTGELFSKNSLGIGAPGLAATRSRGQAERCVPAVWGGSYFSLVRAPVSPASTAVPSGQPIPLMIHHAAAAHPWGTHEAA